MPRTRPTTSVRIREAAGVLVALVAVLVAACAPIGATPAIPGGPTGTAGTASASPTDTTAAPPRQVDVLVAGDLLWHSTTWKSAAEDAAGPGTNADGDRPDEQGFDFAPMFGSMADVIADADLAVCNEEVPIAPAGGPYENYPSFSVPAQVTDGIAEAGYDVCTTATNHSMDQGTAGIVRTVKAFDRAGVAHTGAYATKKAADTPLVVTTESGVTVGIVAGTYGLNGYQVPRDQPWAVDMLDDDAMIARAKDVRRAGADIVIAAMHDGTEYTAAPIPEQVDHAKALTASGQFDLVYGHHAHVVQPWDKVNGTWVVYGLGNQIAQQSTDRPRTYEGITAEFRFTETPAGDFEVTRATAIPTLMTHYTPGQPARLVHVTAALDGAAPIPPGVTEKRLKQARDRTMADVRSLGADGISVG